MIKTVLVTAIGTATATAVIRELKKEGNYHIIGADINPREQIATSLDTDEFFRFPYSTNDEYIPFALEFCKAHNVDYYYAVIDKEVVNLSKNQEQFADIGTKLCVPNYSFAEKCHYKNTFGEWIAEHFADIAVRQYCNLEEAETAVYPLFIKPIEGVASTGCRKISSFNELASNVRSEDVGKTILIQDFVSGNNITVDCVRNRKTGQKIQIQRRELLRNSNGCGIAVEIFHDSALEGICNTLMESLDLHGVCNMEFFETENGYRIIEINPRFSAGTIYSCMAGINTVLNAMKIADGVECQFGKIDVGAHFAERYEAYKMS